MDKKDLVQGIGTRQEKRNRTQVPGGRQLLTHPGIKCNLIFEEKIFRTPNA